MLYFECKGAGFTAGANPEMLFPVIVGKLTAGVAARLLTNCLSQKRLKKIEAVKATEAKTALQLQNTPPLANGMRRTMQQGAPKRGALLSYVKIRPTCISIIRDRR